MTLKRGFQPASSRRYPTFVGMTVTTKICQTHAFEALCAALGDIAD
jgi:hypothetical protein